MIDMNKYVDEVKLKLEEWKEEYGEEIAYMALRNLELLCFLELIGCKFECDGETTGENYVYVAYHGTEIVYVGSGKGNRCEHVTSGASHNRELNRYYFDDVHLHVQLFATGLSREKALKMETALIKLISPRCNTRDVIYDNLTCEHGNLYNAWQAGKIPDDRIRNIIDGGVCL
jgi:hypothetical protein